MGHVIYGHVIYGHVIQNFRARGRILNRVGAHIYTWYARALSLHGGKTCTEAEWRMPLFRAFVVFGLAGLEC